MQNSQSNFYIWCASICFAVMLPISAGIAQTEAMQPEQELKQGHPDRYVVQKGDTLWAIASQFLDDPWRWPLIWQENPEIENPHLIYPGDLLVVTSDRMVKAVRLEPKTYAQPLERAIKTIPPHIIEPFLISGIIIEPGELDNAGHVLSGVEDNQLVLGKYMELYARGLSDTTAPGYTIFRIGKSLSDPETGELLGIEAIHLGDAVMVRAGDDISKLRIIDANREIGPGDKIVPKLEDAPLPYYQPHAPPSFVSGWIMLAPTGVDEVGKSAVVIISGGKREGLDAGTVLKAMLHRGTRIDPVTEEEYDVPDEVSGLLMVFRAFEKLSYALVMESSREIHIGDKYESP